MTGSKLQVEVAGHLIALPARTGSGMGMSPRGPVSTSKSLLRASEKEASLLFKMEHQNWPVSSSGYCIVETGVLKSLLLSTTEDETNSKRTVKLGEYKGAQPESHVAHLSMFIPGLSSVTEPLKLCLFKTDYAGMSASGNQRHSN